MIIVKKNFMRYTVVIDLFIVGFICVSLVATLATKSEKQKEIQIEEHIK